MARKKPTTRRDVRAAAPTLQKQLRTYVAETDAAKERDDEERRRDYKTGFAFAYPPGHDRLNGATLASVPCGCTVAGRGTLPFPVRVVFCEMHRPGSEDEDTLRFDLWEGIELVVALERHARFLEKKGNAASSLAAVESLLKKLGMSKDAYARDSERLT